MVEDSQSKTTTILAMDIVRYFTGDIKKAKSYFKVIKTLYGENHIEKLKKDNSM